MAIRYNDNRYFLTASEFMNEMAIYDRDLENAKTFLADISHEKSNIKLLKETIRELRSLLANANIEEFSLHEFETNGNTKVYIIEYPHNIEKLFKILKTAHSESVPEKLKTLYDKVLFPNGDKTSFNIFVHISVITNRMHIPRGIPLILQDVGFGKKLYRAAIKKFGYISTNRFDRSADAIAVWDSLRKNHDIYSFVKGESMLCVDDSKRFEEVRKIIEPFFQYEIKEEKAGNNLNTYILDTDFRNKYRSEILDTDLKYLLK